MRTLLKRIVMWAYCAGLLPARAVRWTFSTFGLKHL